MHRAAIIGNLTIAQLLLKEGADIGIRDTEGRTPLSHAAKNGHEAIVKLLLDTGKVDANLKDKYR